MNLSIPIQIRRDTFLMTVCLLLTVTYSRSQTFHGYAVAPTDNTAQAGPAVTIAPPGSMQAGDLVVMFAQYRGTGGVTLSVAVNGGQTWNSETQVQAAALTTRIFWCTFNGAWAANPQITIGAGNTQALTVAMYVYRPTHSSSRWVVDVPQTNTTSTSPHTSQGITAISTTMPRAVVMAFWNSAAANTWSGLSGAGWIKTGIDAQVRNTATSGQVHTAAYRFQATAGSTGSVTQVQSTGTISSRSIIAFYEIADQCAGAIDLTSGSTCTNTRSTVVGATNSGIAAPSCGGTPDDDVWFRFTAVQPATSISLSTLGANLSSSGARFELFSGSCGTLTSMGCSSGTVPLNMNTLVPGQTYFVRVYSAGSTAITTAGNFDICVQHFTPPSNDECSGAVSLTPGITCSNTTSNVQRASPSAGLAAPSCGGSADDDVWFRFIPVDNAVTISLSSLGTALSASGVSMEVFSGACGSLVPIACGKTPLMVPGLTGGTQYFVRVYSDGNTSLTANGGFNICVTENRPANILVGKSFVNVSKPGGGTITQGDTLEVRVSVYLTNASGNNNRLFRMRFNDTIPTGVTYLANSMRILTNENKVTHTFTDAPGDDFGFFNSTNNTLRINLGRDTVAAPFNMPVGFVSSTAIDTVNGGGYLNATTHRPRAGGGTLMLLAYRVVVNPLLPFGSIINFGGGAIRCRTQASASSTDREHLPNSSSFIVYPNYGLCANATGSNSISAGNGNFGSGTSHNGSSPGPNVPGYGFVPIATNAPGDGNYAVVKNLSPSQSTNQFVARPQSPIVDRIFGVWDVIGDHTGAADPLAGNPAPATGQPGGYMLAVNAAYQLSIANNQTITGLCENTFYEFSAWFRNVCKRCGSDSTGTGASGVTVSPSYIPTALNDSSGVKPNLTFMIDGVDYYNSGEMDYIGQWGQWVKKGFVFVTAPGQTSLTISIKNNAPGGGGNDWVMDDISFATCLPELQFFPTVSNTLCRNALVQVSSIVSTFYNNYRYYQWERSTDGGGSWHAAPLKPGVDSFTYQFNNPNYLDTIFYPNMIVTPSENGHQYRLRVATTISNLSNSSCNTYSTSAIVTFNVGSCDVLPAQLTSVSGQTQNDFAVIRWSTAEEANLQHYVVERSANGRQFEPIGTVVARGGSQLQQYVFTDPQQLRGKTFYRIRLVAAGNAGEKLSQVLELQPTSNNGFTISNPVNPFDNRIQFQVQAMQQENLEVQLMDMAGKIIVSQRMAVVKGSNALAMPVPGGLQRGGYILQVRSQTGTFNKMLQKQ